jgi:hypothetical protein
MDNSTTTGHMYLLGTLVITLVVPLAVILLSYADIISGVGQIVAAFAVLASAIYIVGGGIWTVLQDKKDLEAGVA